MISGILETDPIFPVLPFTGDSSGVLGLMTVAGQLCRSLFKTLRWRLLMGKIPGSAIVDDNRFKCVSSFCPFGGGNEQFIFV